MSTLQTSLYLVAVVLCIFSTGLTRNAAARKPLLFFTGFLAIQSGVFLCELLISHPSIPFKAMWLALLIAGSLFLAPCLWFTFQESVVGKRPRLRDVPRGHWFAIIGGCLCTVPLMLAAHGGTTFANPLRPAGALESRFIHATMLIAIGIFVFQVPWYVARCRAILLSRLAGTRSHWTQLPLVIVMIAWLLAIVRTVECAFIKWPPVFSMVVAFVSVSVTVVSLYLLLRSFVAPVKKESASYAKSALPSTLRTRIRQKLEVTLSQQAVYRQCDLTLRTLSESVNESPHYVSQVISQDLGTTFYELVNRYRIDEAQRLLRESPSQSVLSIAMEVGFNSKSAFHAAFRRCTGTTPTGVRRIQPGISGAHSD